MTPKQLRFHLPSSPSPDTTNPPSGLDDTPPSGFDDTPSSGHDDSTVDLTSEFNLIDQQMDVDIEEESNKESDIDADKIEPSVVNPPLNLRSLFILLLSWKLDFIEKFELFQVFNLWVNLFSYYKRHKIFSAIEYIEKW